MTRSSNKAFTLLELMLAAFLAMIVVASACGILIFITKFVFVKTQQSFLQWEANVAMETLLRGPAASAGNPVTGLSEAVDFDFPSAGRINFEGTDHVTRSYRLDGTNRLIIYNNGAADTTIYTAPQNATITLLTGPVDDIDLGGGNIAFMNNNVSITVALSKSLLGTTVNGSLTTIVVVRNKGL